MNFFVLISQIALINAAMARLKGYELHLGHIPSHPGTSYPFREEMDTSVIQNEGLEWESI